MLDTLIVNGTIVDGSGKPAYRADLGIAGDRIVVIGHLAAWEAGRTLDATGYYVTPGFVDIHAHSDESAVLNPRMESKVRQGITLELSGNCGGSAAPLRGESAKTEERELARYGYTLDWRSMDDYLRRIEARGISNNFATLVGHGTLRASVMGSAMRPPTDQEFDAMKRLLTESLEAGAWGLSTGLIYSPSSYANTHELIALTEVTARHGGIYASHIRNESDRLLEAVNEAVAIGERTGIPVQISHHKATGKANWGKVMESLALIEDARTRGTMVSCDQYPYTASSTGLAVVVADWAHEGGLPKMVERLRVPALRARVAQEMASVRPGWDLTSGGWRNILVAGTRSNPELQGMTIWEVARLWARDPPDVVMDLLVANQGNVDVVIFNISEDDVQTVMRAPFVMVGSDAGAKAHYGPLSEGKPHPRAYGAFPRVLGRYVRELGVLTWEDAVRKMTGAPVAKVGIPERGLLVEGYMADVVVFDPLVVAETGTFLEPHQYPVGIEYVLVNGVVTVEKGAHTGMLAGRVLRRGNSG